MSGYAKLTPTDEQHSRNCDTTLRQSMLTRNLLEYKSVLTWSYW